MNRTFIKYLLDFIPLLIISIFSIASFWTMLESNISIVWQHYLGIAFILVIVIMFVKNHQLGALFLGLTLVLSLLTFISFNVGVITNYLSEKKKKIPIFYGNALSLGWLILHLIISFRYYVGIATKKYWQDLSMQIKG